MPDPERGFPASRNNSPPDKENTDDREHYPELTEEVRQADIPVLEQQPAVDVLENSIPLLEETFSMFEKSVPVLDEITPATNDPDTAGKKE